MTTYTCPLCNFHNSPCFNNLEILSGTTANLNSQMFIKRFLIYLYTRACCHLCRSKSLVYVYILLIVGQQEINICHWLDAVLHNFNNFIKDLLYFASRTRAPPSAHYYTTKIFRITLTSNYQGHSRLSKNMRTISDHVTAAWHKSMYAKGMGRCI